MSWSPSVFKQNGLQPEVFHQTVWLQNVTFTKWVGLHLFFNTKRFAQNELVSICFYTKRFATRSLSQNNLAPKCHFHKMGWSPSVSKQNGLQPEVFHQTVWLQNVTFTKWVGFHLFLNKTVCYQKSFTKWSGSKMSLSQNELVSICFYTKRFATRSLSPNGLAPKCHFHKMSWFPSLSKQNGLLPEVFHRTVWLQNVTFTKWVGLHLFLYKTVCNQKSFTKRSGSKMSLSQNELVSVCFYTKRFASTFFAKGSASQMLISQLHVFLVQKLFTYMFLWNCLPAKCHFHKRVWYLFIKHV